MAPVAPSPQAQTEKQWLDTVLAEDFAAFGTTEPDSDASAEASHRRGVKIGWLVEFTIKNDCWEW